MDYGGGGANTILYFTHVFAGRRRNARSVGGYLALAGYNPSPAKRVKKEEQDQMNGDVSETKVRKIKNVFFNFCLLKSQKS